MSKKKKKKKINSKKNQHKKYNNKQKKKNSYNKKITKKSNTSRNKKKSSSKKKNNSNVSKIKINNLNKKNIKINNKDTLTKIDDNKVKEVKNETKNLNKKSIKIQSKNSLTKNNDIVKVENNKELTKRINTKEKKSINKKYILISSLFIILILLTTLLVINKNLKLSLIGNDNETIEVFSEYKDPGIKVSFFDSNIDNKVIVNSNLDNKKIGTYKITYSIKFLNIKKKTRIINVVDTTPPEISLIGDDMVNIYLGNKYIDEGINIKDNYDNNLENNIKIDNPVDTSNIGTYTITYTVSDNSNNISSITRIVNVKNRVIINNNKKSCSNLNKIETYICENNYDVSVGYYNLTNNKTYYYKSNKLYYGASLIKTLDALYLYDKGLITDNLDTYVKKAITVSDNPSHHYLVNYIGKNNLKEYGISIGAKNTLVGGDNFGSTSVNDQIAYMKKLYEITKDNQNPKLKEYFLNTRKNCLLFEDSPQIMHKYGHWTYVYHNSGIVLDKNPYIVTILTNEGYDNYQKIIKTLSKLIYEYHIENS